MPKLLKYSLLACAAGGLLMGQGRGGGGAHGGGAGTHGDGGAHGGGYAAVAAAPVHSSFSGYRGGAGLLGSNPSFHTGVASQPTRVNRVIRNRDAGFRSPYRFGYGAVLPYYPYFGSDNFWNEPTGYNPAADTSAEQTNEVTANLLGEQMQRLTVEVESLRGAPAGYPPSAGPQAYPMQAPPADDPAEKPIVLVLRGGQTLQIQNYAIVNGVLWDFTKPNSKRIPLTSIDAQASEKATEQGGGSFPEASFATNPN